MRIVSLTLSLLFILVACKSAGEPTDSTATAAEDLGQAIARLQSAPSWTVEIKADESPSNVNTLSFARGVGDMSPAFEGDVTVVANGSAIEAEVVSVDGKVFAKTSLSPRFSPLDPASIGAPDPAQFFTAENGILALMANATNITYGEEIRQDMMILQSIKAVIPGSNMAQFLPGSDPSGIFNAEFFIDKDKNLQRITLIGPFYANHGESTYSVKVTANDSTVDIKAP